jgi:quercetin dioxygenase-like cupin family protein
MSITCRTTIGIAWLALGLIVTTEPTAAQSHHVLVLADAVKWGPAPPALPAGAEISVLEGNPGEKGAVTMRLKFPANYDIPPHWHSMTERVTVLSGALNVGMGDKLDRNASQRLAPGGFVSLPANMRHFAWTTTPTVVQISLEGPFDIVYVNPADDPQTRQSKR